MRTPSFASKPVRWPSEAVVNQRFVDSDGLGGPSYNSIRRLLRQSLATATVVAVLAAANASFAVTLPFSENFDSGSAPDFIFSADDWAVTGAEDALDNNAAGTGALSTAAVQVTGDLTTAGIRMSSTFQAGTFDGNNDIGFAAFGTTGAFELFALGDDNHYLGDVKPDGSMRILQVNTPCCVGMETIATGLPGSFSFSSAETYELVFEVLPAVGGGFDMSLTIDDPSEGPITIAGTDTTPLTGEFFGYRTRVDPGLGGSGSLAATFDDFALTAAVSDDPFDLEWSKGSSGLWDVTDNWGGRWVPSDPVRHQTVIAGQTPLLVIGSAEDRQLRSLLVSGSQLPSPEGAVELRLEGGRQLSAAQGVTIGPRGRISGSAVINAIVTVESGGELMAAAGDTLEVGFVQPNEGSITALGTMTFSAPLTNNPDGQINAIGGTLNFNAGLTNNGQLNLINATINGTVNSPAAVVAASGSNAISGDVHAQFELSVELRDNVDDYDRLEIGGDATLAGALSVTLGNGYEPQQGDTFDIVTYQSRSGTFTDVEVPELDGGRFWHLDHNPNQLELMVIEQAHVVGRHLSYEGSAFGDDVAHDKEALLPGAMATAENLSSFSRGINAVVVDMDHLPLGTSLGAGEFEFRVGNTNDPSQWQAAPDPLSVTVDEAAGTDDADRVRIVWADGAIENQWLEVTLLAGDATGMLQNDVFYFGSAVGKTGKQATDALVNAADLIAVRDHPRGPANPAEIDNPFDLNRDGLVDAKDIVVARNNAGSPLSMLRLLDLSVAAAPQPAPVPEPSSLWLAILGLFSIAARGRYCAGRR